MSTDEDDDDLPSNIPPEVIAMMAVRDMLSSYKNASPIVQMGIVAAVGKVISTGILHGKVRIQKNADFMIARLDGFWLRNQALNAQGGGAQNLLSAFVGALSSRPPMMQKLLADVLAQALTSGVLEGQIQLEADGEDVIARIPRAWFRAHGGERLLDVGT